MAMKMIFKKDTSVGSLDGRSFRLDSLFTD